MADSILQSKRSPSHTTRSGARDIEQMVQILLDNDIASEKEKRKMKESTVDPRREGLQKIADGWLRRFLCKDDVSVEDCDDSRREISDISDLIY